MINHNVNDVTDLLDSLKVSLPLVQKLFPIDVMFALADLETFVYYLPGNEIDIHILEGMPVPQSGGIRKALDSGEAVSTNIPKEVYGLPFKSSSLPIKAEDGRIVGVFTIGISLVNQETLSDAANSMATTSEEINLTTEEIAGTASDLANTISGLKVLGQNVVQELHKTDEILDFIKKVSDNSNLLGLNASIEAAHAAEHGRGFGVVAQEIRKMAVSSASSVQEITAILQTIKSNINLIDETLMDCLSQGERQAAATEQISASMQQLAASAVEIEKIARLI